MAEEKAWSREKIKAKIEGNELDLSLCSISKVPVNHIIPFGKVTALDLSCNKINTLPENFSKLVQLVQLDLSKNGITELPHDFGELNHLRRLDLFNNHLLELPLTFYKLKSLQWLDLKANPIQEQLPRLVGDCLRPAECQQCAKNIVKHYSNLQGEKLMQERLAKKLESERKAKEKQEEEQIRQRRKEEKKKRFEEKSLANVQRKSQNTNGSIDISKVEPTCIEGKSSSGRSCTWYLMYFVLLLAVAGLIVVVLLKADKQQIQLHVDQIVEKSRTYFNKLTKNYLL